MSLYVGITMTNSAKNVEETLFVNKRIVTAFVRPTGRALD